MFLEHGSANQDEKNLTGGVVTVLVVEFKDEHSAQARAQHTNGPRDEPWCGAMSLLQKTLHYKGEFTRNRAQLLCMWALAQLLSAPAFYSQGT
jgi:hypothetical protein